MSFLAPDEELNRIAEAVRAEGESFPLLEAIWRAQESGLTLDQPALAALASACSCDLEQLGRLAEFAQALRDGRETPIRVCLGLSCRSKGSPGLHERLYRRLPEGAVVQEMHCLDNCDRGPSLALGERIYSGGEEDVRTEERGWRRCYPRT